jgi:L-ascorbate metabolism protein UlaG (beta-lactamase superfamily)
MMMGGLTCAAGRIYEAIYRFLGVGHATEHQTGGEGLTTRLLASLKLALLVALASFWMTPISGAAERELDATSSESKGVALKWLGVAGWEIRTGRTIVLIDPFLTRKDRSPDAEWKTDEEAVLKVINGAHYIFAGHSHADHIGDIPFIAKRFGSKVIGSRTTTNIALTAGVDKSQLVTIRGGEKFDFEDFSVQVIESQHGVLTRSGRRRQPKSEEILEPLSGPVVGNVFVEGGSYLYFFTFGKHRVLHQSTGNFIEENLKGLQPDLAILAENSHYDGQPPSRFFAPKRSLSIISTRGGRRFHTGFQGQT